MTTFLFYSFRVFKISPYIIFKKNFLSGFWRPPPGGARGQMPPPAPPRYATVSMCTDLPLCRYCASQIE